MDFADSQVWAEFAIAVAAAYLAGSIPFGLLIGKLHHIDIRQHGSGNIGATNVTRVVGKWAGRLCFACDFLKGALPVLAVRCCLVDHKVYAVLALSVGLAAVLGHMFPVYLKFKGGKGISTAAGAAVALAPLPLLIAAAVWTAVFFAFRYVSLASIAAAWALPAAAWVLAHFGIGDRIACSPSTLVFFAVVALIATLKHRENIKRLLNGTESRFKKH